MTIAMGSASITRTAVVQEANPFPDQRRATGRRSQGTTASCMSALAGSSARPDRKYDLAHGRGLLSFEHEVGFACPRERQDRPNARPELIAVDEGGQREEMLAGDAHEEEFGANLALLGTRPVGLRDCRDQPAASAHHIERAGLRLASDEVEHGVDRLHLVLDLTPHDFVEGARVDAACNLLDGSEIPLKTVAYDCGFGNPERMRAVFCRRLRLSPAQYRDSFRMRTGRFDAA